MPPEFSAALRTQQETSPIIFLSAPLLGTFVPTGRRREVAWIVRAVPPDEPSAQCQPICRRQRPLQHWTTKGRQPPDLSANESCRLRLSARVTLEGAREIRQWESLPLAAQQLQCARMYSDVNGQWCCRPVVAHETSFYDLIGHLSGSDTSNGSDVSSLTCHDSDVEALTWRASKRHWPFGTKKREMRERWSIWKAYRRYWSKHRTALAGPKQSPVASAEY